MYSMSDVLPVDVTLPQKASLLRGRELNVLGMVKLF